MMRHHDRRCPVCERLIEPNEPVSFQHGVLLHMQCYETGSRVERSAGVLRRR